MEKQNTRIKIIAVIIAAALLLAACAAFGYSLALKSFEVIPDIAASENGSEISASIKDSDRVKLKYSAAMAADAQELTAVITATVTPEGASGVEWTLSWESAEETANISEYAYLEPNGLSVTVHVTAPFKDKNMIVTATTEIGGFTATCRLRYEGKPTHLALVNEDDFEWNTDNEWGVPIAVLMTGKSYTLNFAGENKFGEQSEITNIMDVDTVESKAYGNVKALVRATQGGTEEVEETVDLSSVNLFGERQLLLMSTGLLGHAAWGGTGVGALMDSYDYSTVGSVTVKFSNSFKGNGLTGLITDYDEVTETHSKCIVKVLEVNENKPPYIELKFQAEGLSYVFRFTIKDSVSGVSVNPPEIVF